MKRIILTLVLSLLSVGANAALIDRGNGFVYDDDLDVTWAQDSNSFGLGNWYDAVTWADGLSITHPTYGTFSDWRLPSADLNGDNVIDTSSALCELTGCPDSELSHLAWEFISLGGCSNAHIVGFNGVTPCNGGGGIGFWTSTSDWLDPNYALVHSMGSPSAIDFQAKPLPFNYSIAVRSGDVAASVVPIPAAVYLFASGLGLLGWFRRKG